jgi:acetyl-CoA synthetase
VAEKNIESVLLEEREFPPPPAFTAKARLKSDDLEKLYEAAAADHEGFWADQARKELTWKEPFTVSLDDSDAPNYRWFTDGRLNVSFNCLDVHLDERGDKTAIIFEGEAGDTRRLTYRELHAEVCRFAGALRAQGVERGDRVIIYLPLIPEAVIAMHACNRLGAIHSVVFGGFSAIALKDRIVDTGAKVVITADGGWRGGHVVELKAAADKAISSGCPSVEKVVVVKRTGKPVDMNAERDVWWSDIVEGQSSTLEPEWVDAEHPLFLLYTSGSTGKPKGIQHSSAGYLLQAKLSSRWVFDLQEDDVFWCTADVGWVTGHTYVAYGPLANGTTILLYEGAPTTPDGGRFWKNCQTHGVTILYTAPTAIRALMKLGDEWPAKYDLSKLRLLGTVGEPINPEAWMWYHRVIGGERCPIVDTWWQTETGATLISPLPATTATKPGSCTRPLPGIAADIVDDEGKSVTKPEAGGYLVIREPWPSMLRTIWGDNDRYMTSYWEKFNNRFYVAGDSARRDKDGYFWIMGRIDDVLNVAGHRLGTMEIESALVANPLVAEAAVVGRPHDIKGESVFAFVVLRGSRPTDNATELVQKLRTWVGEQVGAIAKPDDIRFADNLPKTRSGKIMRRLLRSIARGEEILQDVSTLENPAILDQLRGVESDAAPADKSPAKGKRKPPAKGVTPARQAGGKTAEKPAKRAAKPANTSGSSLGKTVKEAVKTAVDRVTAVWNKATGKTSKQTAKKAPAKTLKQATARLAAAKLAASRLAFEARQKAPVKSPAKSPPRSVAQSSAKASVKSTNKSSAKTPAKSAAKSPAKVPTKSAQRATHSVAPKVAGKTPKKAVKTSAAKSTGKTAAKSAGKATPPTPRKKR